MTVDSLKGQLLLASPALFDPNFRRTVVLIGEHSDEGAMGVVLNRPSEAVVSDAVPELAELVEDDAPVWVGGPVQRSTLMVLAEFEDPEHAASIVVDDVGFASSDEDFTLLAASTRRARIFAGYAGWGPGQLEAELEESSWIVEPATGVDLFAAAADDLWGSILRRKGGIFRMVALMPEDPALN